MTRKPVVTCVLAAAMLVASVGCRERPGVPPSAPPTPTTSEAAGPQVAAASLPRGGG